ncbi:putative uncharacterized protein [Roseburia sp. CAG:380]|nr:putative uncharacterized protein [Roseburia sp. CAG:380]
MRACRSLGMKPPVATVGEVEGKLIILIIIPSDVHMKTIRRNIMKRLTLCLNLATAAFGFRMLLDIAALRKLPADQAQIFLLSCNIKCIADRLEMLDFLSCLLDLDCQRLKGSLKLGIFLEISLGIVHRRLRLIKWDRYFLAGIIILTGKAFLPAGKAVTICCKKITIDLVFITLLSIPKLFFLQIVFLAAALQRRVGHTTKLKGFLMDSRIEFLLRIIIIQQTAHAVIHNTLTALIPLIRSQVKCRKLHRLLSAPDHGRHKGVGEKLFPKRLKIAVQVQSLHLRKRIRRCHIRKACPV